MEITFIRHGRSRCTEKKRMKSSDFMEWVAVMTVRRSV